MQYTTSTFSYSAILFILVFITSSKYVGAAPVQWTIASGGNGHFYEFVAFNTLGELNWSQSKTAAESAGGYLVTITSAGEQAFLESINSFGTNSFWMGASDAATEGVWEWVTGPEAGTQFWQGSASGSTTAPFNYANWFSGEPDFASEDYGVFFGDGTSLTGWNNADLNSSVIGGYILESVPLPASIWLFASGLGLLGWKGRRSLNTS